jgi:hypothetical protein
MNKATVFGLGLTLVGVALAIVKTPAQSPLATPPRKILFVGDSFTYAQGGIYTHFERLAAAAPSPLVVTADKAVAGGAFLKVLWEMKEAVKAIDTGAYEVVLFVEEVRKHNGRPVLFMAWAYQRLGWISMPEIAKAHRELAKELNVDVAPVGLAWQRSSAARPALDMYGPDREHPSIHGSYLATCVVYATIYGTDPTGFSYRPPGISAEDAAFLQRTAWQTVQDYRAGKL